MYSKFFKRFFDVITSCVALIILFLPFLIISIIIKIDSTGPIFFRQVRIGKNGIKFKIYKFRSMFQGAPHNMATSELDNANSQITCVGKFIRKTSIDELPQFINVLKGDMSIIGPRPVIPTELELIEMRKKNGANGVLPGLTGLAQVHGRDELSNFNKANYDGLYATTLCFNNDLKICLRTIWYVILHVGIKEGSESSSDVRHDNIQRRDI